MNNLNLEQLSFYQIFGDSKDYYDVYIKLNDELDKKLNENNILYSIKRLEYSYRYRNEDSNDNETFLDRRIKMFKKTKAFKSIEFNKIITFLNSGIVNIFDETDILKMYIFNKNLFKFYLAFLNNDAKYDFKLDKILKFSGFLQLYGSQIIDETLHEMKPIGKELAESCTNLIIEVKDYEKRIEKLEKRIEKLERGF